MTRLYGDGRFGNGDDKDPETYPDEEMWTNIIHYLEKQNSRIIWPEAAVLMSFFAFIAFVLWLIFVRLG